MKSSDRAPAVDARLKRLAEKIESLSAKDEEFLRVAREMAELRSAAAREIYEVCADFVAALNSMLARTEVLIDPGQFVNQELDDSSTALIQINIRGRILQFEYGASDTLISTEEFRIPYTLAGSIRAFNQELLEKDVIEEQLIFYTIEKAHRMWRFFDARTYRSGPVDQAYLISLMEGLL